MAFLSRLKPIHDQTLVITGASSGIGLTTARKAARQGARVVLSSRNRDELNRISEELNAEGCRTIAVEADVTQPEELERLRDAAIAEFGSIDTWVNNAGTSIYGKLMDTKLDDERELFEINYWSVRNGSHIAVEAMKEKGGVLINVGSEVSARAVPLQGTYAATKHALKAFTDALRMELERDKVPVRVTLIRPTAIDTPFPVHSANELREGEPSLPAMAYSPDLVADAILRCAVHPQRDVFVGGSARFFSVMEALFPRFTDFIMEKVFFSQQMKGSGIPHRRENEALWKAGGEEGRERGDHRARVRNTSVYTFLALRPGLALLGAVGAGAAALYFGGALKRKPSRRDLAEETRAGW